MSNQEKTKEEFAIDYIKSLAAVEEDVSFIARGEHLNDLKIEGQLLKGDGEEIHLKPIMESNGAAK